MFLKQGATRTQWESASDAELGQAIRAGVSGAIQTPPDEKAAGSQRQAGADPEAADEAFTEIYRRHRGSVLAYARACCRDPHTAEDLTAEAFTQTLRAVRAGVGPDAAWRPYLLTVVRRTAAQWLFTSRRIELSEDFHTWIESLPAPVADAEQTLLEREDRSLVLQAFRSLPERWQLVLWHTAVEGESAEQVGVLLGITPSGVSSLAFRAREGLREAYLQAHLAQMDNQQCGPFRGLLAAAVRRSGVRRTKSFERHIRTCPRCASAFSELEAINGGLDSALPSGLLLWGLRPATPSADPDPAGTADGGAPPRSGRLRQAMKPSASGAVIATVIAATVITTAVALPALYGSRVQSAKGRTTTPASSTLTAGPPSPSTHAPSVSASATPSASVPPSTSAPPRSRPSPLGPPPVLNSGTAPPTTADPSSFRLVNQKSGQCVTVPAEGAGNDGTGLVQEPCDSSDNQRWIGVDAGDGWVQLRNVGTGRCLDNDKTFDEDSTIVQWTCHTEPIQGTQLWSIDTSGSAYHEVVSEGNGLWMGLLDWDSDSPPSGDSVTQSGSHHDSSAFHWLADYGTS